MKDILKLKLNADWVILSACNTGASDNNGREAISGLGRAFFYAGTKSILVSMWPVETTSAMELTTETFRFYKQKKLSRAEALRMSMLQLIERESMFDSTNGQQIVSYAHPLFWAPFVVVGDGSGKF
jgi:CHAT domain-containing protein